MNVFYDVFPFVLRMWEFVSILRKEYESEESENKLPRTEKEREKVIGEWKTSRSLIVSTLILIIFCKERVFIGPLPSNDYMRTT
jgi:hypothetical protein